MVTQQRHPSGPLSSDAVRLGRVREVLARGGQRGSWQGVGYAVYVAALFGLAWGLPLAQQALRAVDPGPLRAAAQGSSPVAVTAWFAGTVATLAALAWLVGRVRGPIAPDLSYIDLVVASPLDRLLTVRPWWRLALFGSVVAGTLLGLVLTGAMAFLDLAGVGVLAAGALAGASAGVAVAWAWLLGQTSARGAGRSPLAVRSGGQPVSAGFGAGRSGTGGHPLRRLTVPALHDQAITSRTMGGAALMGDLRGARLAAGGRPMTGRALRLRPDRAFQVIVRRDVIGLRRNPIRLVTAMLAMLLGSGLLCLRVGGVAAAPLWTSLLGALVGSAGLLGAAEGLRLQGDNTGTPALLGIPPRHEAIAHLALPALLYAVNVTFAGGALALAGLISPEALPWVTALGGIMLGQALIGAFRGLAPVPVFSPRMGIPALIGWAVAPGLFAWLALLICVERARAAVQAVVGGAAAEPASGAAAHAVVSLDAVAGALSLLGALTVGMLGWGFHRQQVQTDAHRG